MDLPLTWLGIQLVACSRTSKEPGDEYNGDKEASDEGSREDSQDDSLDATGEET